MHNELITHICDAYRLGKLITQPERCTAGRLHFTYKITTAQNNYVVKILHPSVYSNISAYEISEKIAAEIQPEHAAHQYHNRYVFQSHDQFAIVYPYILGSTLASQENISPRHAYQIAIALAKIHALNYPLLHSVKHEASYHHITSPTVMKRLKEIDSDIATSLSELQQSITDIITYYQQHESLLSTDSIVSHCDLDIKNVLWDADDHCSLIDWESIGNINRTRDVISTALYWSFADNYQIRPAHFSEFINTYQNHYKKIDAELYDISIYALLIDWLNWLEFNIKTILSITDINEMALRKEEAKKTLDAIPIVFKQIHLLKNFSLPT